MCQQYVYVLIVLVLCIRNNVFTVTASKAITFRADRTITRNIKSIIDKHDNIIISQTEDVNDIDVTYPKGTFAEWFRRKDAPLAILNSNPGIVRVEEVDDQKYKAHIAPLTFPGNLQVCNII